MLVAAFHITKRGGFYGGSYIGLRSKNDVNACPLQYYTLVVNFKELFFVSYNDNANWHWLCCLLLVFILSVLLNFFFKKKKLFLSVQIPRTSEY